MEGFSHGLASADGGQAPPHTHSSFMARDEYWRPWRDTLFLHDALLGQARPSRWHPIRRHRWHREQQILNLLSTLTRGL